MGSKKGPMPIDSSNLLSRISYWYAFPLLKLSAQRPITEDDLWGIIDVESAATNSERLRVSWEKEKERKQKNASFFVALSKSNLPIMLYSMLCTALWCGMIIFMPIYLVRNLILFVQADEYEPSGWAAGFFVGSLVQSVLMHQIFWMSFRWGCRMRSSTATLIYQKSLRLKTTGNIGEVANLVSNDCQRLQELGLMVNYAWILPVEVCIVGGLLIGWAGIIGLVFMFLLAFFQMYSGRLIRNYRIKSSKFTDERVKLMSEILIAIKLVKFYAWEIPFANHVSEARATEVAQIRNLAYLRATNFIQMFVGTSLTTLVVFAAYVGSGHTLTAETAFVVLALINSTRFPLSMFPLGVKSLAEGLVAARRVQNFLEREELPPRQAYSPLSDIPVGAPVIKIDDADFSWDDAQTPALRNINLAVPRGHLIAVVGPVGSGKSSLLAAIMEQVACLKGKVTVHGSLAFVPQQAWIQNLTLRDNVLFGSPYDPMKYDNTIKVCALEQDLKQLLAGDQTEIGERGINLSGGQKQRVSIARAVYADEDVVLLDDPLSAVDQHVGKHLFEKCIKEALKGKTVILVTHQLQYLPQCDSVIVMANGAISAQGTFDELMNKMDFSELIGQHVDLDVGGEKTEEESKDNEEDGKSAENKERDMEKDAGAGEGPSSLSQDETKKKEADDKTKGKLTSVEAQKGGGLKSGTFSQYIYNGGVFVAVLVLLLHILSQGANILSFWWITYWTGHPNQDGLNIGIYAMLVGTVLVLCTIRELLYQAFTLRASTNIHNLMFRTILRAPMSFFDVTPLGRILNRFTTDMDTIDYQFPDVSMQALHYGFQVVGVVALISAFLYYIPLLLIPMGFVYAFAQYYYKNANRDIKRIDSASKSPLFQHLSSTLQGLSVLRAFRQEPAFSLQNLSKVDHAARCSIQMFMIQRWFAFLLDFITACLVFATAALCIGLRDSVTAAQAGLAITYSMQLAGTFQWTVRTYADSEAQMTSVERILEYCNPDLEDPNEQTKRKIRQPKKSAYERLPYEAPPIIPDNRPDPSWPSQGVVEFDHVTIEYTKGTPVLHDLTFKTRPMEKIGIVGRTGAGKSTVALALFRMMECAHGRILIDGQDTSLLGTHDLRSRVGIIPQDPVLFEGTVRSNLDPFGKYEDKDIWKTLQQVHLDSVVSNLPNKLDAKVEANGENWSVGQRQLICIGRALLKHCKVLVLDEATAAVDLETDSLIQETIRSNFSDCCILTIAHRLNTIIDSDRVMVLDKGRIVEFDHPFVLLSNENKEGDGEAIFRGMVEKMGPAAFARLFSISQKIYQSMEKK